MYLYGGCKTPPHECADKETMRAMIAGMALQSIMRNVNAIIRLEEYDSYCKVVANNARRMADALLSELDKGREEYGAN